MDTDFVRPLRVVPVATIDQNVDVEEVALFNAAGAPVDLNAPVFSPITTATAIGTAAKTTTSPEPAANTLVVIKFTNGNSAASPTVAFNGGAARNILLAGAAPTGAESAIAANGIGLYFFDGTALHQAGVLA